MGRKHKKPGNRKPMPEWMKQVDSDMFLYVKWGRIIEHQQNILRTLELTGPSMTPVYELREGTPGGDTIFQQEKWVIAKEVCQTKIDAGLNYRASLDEMVRAIAAGDKDKETFIRRYWWTGDNRDIRSRTALVLDALDFLAHKDWKTGKPGTANRTFGNWRKDIYAKLAENMGHWPEEKLDLPLTGRQE